MILPKKMAGIREVVIPVEQKWVLDELKQISPGTEYVFVREDGTRMDFFSIRKRLYRICKKLGLQKKSPHKIRKTYLF